MPPSLPPCPVPLFHFPKPYPYSAYPVVAGSLPKSLAFSNPFVRVRIPDPWAQTLQLFEHAPRDSEAQAKLTKEYACYTVYSRPGHRHVETLAPPGSTFDFAWNMFRKIFKQKVGVDWEDREPNQEGALEDSDGECRVGGEDGADDDDEAWDFFGPLRFKQQSQGSSDAAAEATLDRRPSATVVVNSPEVMDEGQIEVRAQTPRGGW